MKKCPIHPRYQGANKPKNKACGTCWEIYRHRLDASFEPDEMLKTYGGRDTVVGRPIRLNQVTLECKPGKDYAQVMPFGDLHLGYPQCNLNEARHYLEWARKNRVYVLLMGDIIECGTTTSIGDSVYSQTLNPQRQMEEAIELLQPLAADGLIIGLHEGNHEQRVHKSTSIDISKIMAKELSVRYLRYACWSLLRVGSQKYSMYSMHGRSGARFKHTKMKTVIDQIGWLKADILAMGHVHSKGVEEIPYQEVDKRNRQVIQSSCHVFLTGSYIDWDRSYAQAENYPITTIGSPTIKLMADKHNVAGSV